MKEYKGITWKTRSELSIKLGHERGYISHMLTANPDLSEEKLIDRHLGKIYRDIRWRSLSELAEKLNIDRSTISKYQQAHPELTEEDCIDRILDSKKTYRGISWNNLYQLSKALNVSNSYIYVFLKKNPQKTVEDYIDLVLSKTPHSGTYKELSWTNWAELSIQLGKSESYVRVWMKRNSDKTIEECIDYILEKSGL